MVKQGKPIDTAPFNRNVQLAVLDSTGTHIVAFPCRLAGNGWIDAETNKQVYYMLPTHWRDWLVH
jgi:hypothetical protein